MNALDTNVWIYANDARDPHKQAIALDLVGQVRPLVLPWQVGCEFLSAARKLEPQGFGQARAWAALADMRSMADAIILPTERVWDRAMSIQSQWGLSLWDSLLASVCVLGGVKTLYSEDFGTIASIDGLQLVNPFK